MFHAQWFAVLSALGVLAVNVALDTRTGTHVGDSVATAYVALYGLYCLQNYPGCREAHCAITGPGFSVAALAMGLRTTGILDHCFGVPYVIFVLAAAAGHSVEARSVRVTGSRFRR